MYNAAKDTTDNFKTANPDAAAAAKEEICDTANKAGRQIRSFLDTASTDVSKATDSIAEQVRSNPVQASLIALGAGFVLGALLRR